MSLALSDQCSAKTIKIVFEFALHNVFFKKKCFGKRKFPLQFLGKITDDSANVLHPKYFTKWGAMDFEVALYTIAQIIFGKIQEENVPIEGQ